NCAPDVSDRFLEAISGLLVERCDPHVAHIIAIDFHAYGWGRCVNDFGTAIRSRRRESATPLTNANELERRVKGLIVFRVRGDVGLRAGFTLAVTFKMARQRCLAAHSTLLEFSGNVLEHLYIGYDTLGLDGVTQWCEVARCS